MQRLASLAVVAIVAIVACGASTKSASPPGAREQEILASTVEQGVSEEVDGIALSRKCARTGRSTGVAMAGDPAVILATAFGGALIFGFYLMLLAMLGLEHQQAFTVLGHPGFKHFVRLRVHPDGRVEGWTIGKDDMLAEAPPLLVDRFEWKPDKP